jgi:hypothetical protein
MFGIRTVLGKVFGTDKAAASLINTVSSGLDKLVYTSEEKAEDQAKAITEARTMLVNWMDATKGQNLARRLIALSIVSIWLFQYIACMFLNVVAIWVANSDKLIESANIIGGYAEKMNGAVMLILGFYFAAPYMGKMVDGAMAKFSGK